MIHSHIEINSSSEDVWRILLDFKSYPEWNPFIKSIHGEPKTGTRLKVSIHAPEMKPQDFSPVVNTVWENKQFRWKGRLGIPGLFEGEHMFIIEELDPRKIRFHQNEVFKGILVPMFDNVLRQTLEGFNYMNEALKERAEEE